MAICKYFLQGKCRYGDNCWYEHQAGGNQGFRTVAQRQLFGAGGQQKVTFRDSFGSNSGQSQNPYKWQNPQSNSTSTQQAVMPPSEILKGLGTEMTIWETAQIWPFSCLGYEKESASIPGFEDFSFEELRHEAYLAQKSGDIQSYVRKVEGLINEVNARRHELKNLGMQLKQKMISVIEDDRRRRASGSSGSSSALFSGSFQSSAAPSVGLFGQGSGSSSVFGQGSGSSSVFGQGSGSSSVFGQSLSGGGEGSGGFGGGSMFGTSESAGSQTQSLLGQTDSTKPPTLFGKPVQQSSATFGSTGFGSGQQPGNESRNLFGKSFQSVSTTVSTGPQFGSTNKQQQPTSLFGQSPANSSSMGISLGSTESSQHSTVYTAIGDLTPKDLEEFKKDVFTLGAIPTRPPPKELC